MIGVTHLWLTAKPCGVWEEGCHEEEVRPLVRCFSKLCLALHHTSHTLPRHPVTHAGYGKASTGTLMPQSQAGITGED
ncbi:hypothetical protein E2C01_054202 [Portunus trituberculatus]|uniref:Uncharacterized protein n=1 Tax=Portunus trituberculatus TaxID=210409 RepID=A0A5B7GS51_PORTR|nr:hypothetical protein [Portunus trituberculatus]